jgi:hypothetical protein
MSETLHPGSHPDADQLSAFAEHVLPDHERLETLAHLAECAGCRQIVFLAQRAQEAESTLPRAVPGSTGWWKNWHILWPVAAALTCGLLVIALLQRRHPRDLPQRSDIALESSAPTPPSQALPPQYVSPAPPQPGPPLSPKSSAAAKAASSSLHSRSAASHVDVGGVASIHGNLVTNNLKTNSSGFSSGFNPNEPAADQQSANALSAGSQSMGGVMNSPVAQAPLSQGQRNGLLTNRQVQTTDLQSQNPQSHNQLFPQQAAAAPRSQNELSQSNMPNSVSQTVTVTSAPIALQSEDAVVSASAFNLGGAPQARSARALLPSRRFAASTISNEIETLAVDSAGDLFLSKDAGKSWQRITHQWTGKAIKVSLESPASVTQPVSRKAMSAGAIASTNGGTATPAAVPPGAGFELRTDTGAIWSSPDGLIWKLK